MREKFKYKKMRFQRLYSIRCMIDKGRQRHSHERSGSRSPLGGGTVLLARDARITGRMVADAISAGLLSTGVNVVRAGVIPTPTLAFITKHGGFASGVMVTASHNPPEYTGVKFWRSDSMGYTPEEEMKLEKIYNEGKFATASWDRLGTESVLETAVWDHIDETLKRCDVEAIRKRGFKVVVDPGNGAACVLTPYLMQQLGCQVIGLNSQLDGHFPGRKSEPEEATLGDLVNIVKTTGADLGIAHDGDSDRVVFVTDTGEVVRGDRTIALLAREALASAENKIIVTTVDSSRALDETVEAAGGSTIRTPVGDIQVAIKVRETGAVLGGEACGVFIFPEFHLAPEPFLAACRLLQLMARTERSLSDLISEIPKYPLRKTKVTCPNEKKVVTMKRLSTVLPSELSGVTDVITVDGVGLMLERGWVLVRPSGTEPVIRITCEAPTDKDVEEILSQAQGIVEATLSDM